MKNYKEILPCGWLHSQGKKFFLLKPYPTVGDSWETDSMARFLVVPYVEFEDRDYKNHAIANENKFVYPHARHVVVSGFCLEYQADMPTILYEKIKEEYSE